MSGSLSTDGPRRRGWAPSLPVGASGAAVTGDAALGTNLHMIRPNAAQVAASAQNKVVNPVRASVPPSTIAADVPRLTTQNSKPNARARSGPGTRSATSAEAAGRYRSVVKPVAAAATASSARLRAYPSPSSVTELASIPTVSVARRPSLLAMTPPTTWESIEPTP